LAPLSASELADECVRFGLEPSVSDHDDPWKSERRYAERRIRHWKMPELVALARAVAEVYDDRVLVHLQRLAMGHGVDPQMQRARLADPIC
jgi:hypothetical protein